MLDAMAAETCASLGVSPEKHSNEPLGLKILQGSERVVKYCQEQF